MSAKNEHVDLFEFFELSDDTDIRLAENKDVKQNVSKAIYQEKRQDLLKTKIIRQAWSTKEFYQKIHNDELNLNPDYQRAFVWNKDKQSAFIESIFMRISIPPIYVVEMPREKLLDGQKYEVVDGKQRLNTILSFLNNKLKLKKKALEYYPDIFGNKKYTEIEGIDPDGISDFLSYSLDVYVIGASTPSNAKYDIFARLNKGSTPLKVNEIRHAIYKSKIVDFISYYVEKKKEKPEFQDNYNSIFSKSRIRSYDDLGRFYQSISFYLKADFDKLIIKDYNSRPREMINSVLNDIQKDDSYITKEEVTQIIEHTIELEIKFSDIEKKQYLIDSFSPFLCKHWDKLKENIDKLTHDKEIQKTLEKSPGTTAHVNKRFNIIFDQVINK